LDPLAVTLTSTVVLALVGAGAGFIGALVGIGGGIIIVPALVIGFGLDMRDAVAVSLISVVATSTAAGSVYVGRGLANMRLGMTLEVVTTLGGMAGGMVALVVPTSVLAALFAGILVVTAVLLARGRDREGHGGGSRKGSPPARAGVAGEAGEAGEASQPAGWEERGRLAGAYHDAALGRLVHYEVTRLPLGGAISFVAGAMSGMLGVGGGFLKVPAMNLGMRVPMRVAAATSNFMIGVTASASLSVYLARGYVRPLLAAPVVIGVVFGSLAGTRLAHRAPVRVLKWVLAALLVTVAVQMGLRAMGGTLGE
jgi:uncharacterized membrane protein YfcA